MDDILFGPIDPGKPILFPYGGTSGVPAQATSRRGRSTSSSEKDDVNALWGQKREYRIQDAEFSMQQSMMKMQLFNLLKHKHQGDKANFINDPEVTGLITKIQELDAIHYANKDAIELEKENYIKAKDAANANLAMNDYAVDERGQRYYIDEKTGKIKKSFDTDKVYLKVGELYKYQRDHLSFDGVKAQQGEWVQTIDKKARYFNTELKSWLKDAAAKENTSKSPTVTASTPDGLFHTNEMSFLASRNVYSSNNHKQLRDAANGIRGSLSRAALMDAKQEYWDAGHDKLVTLITPKGQLAYVSPEKYEKLQKGKVESKEDLELLNSKKVVNEENKFNIFLVQKARELINPLFKSDVRTTIDYHKLTEAQAGAYVEMNRTSTLGSAFDPAYIVNANPIPDHRATYKKVASAGDGRPIFKKTDIEVYQGVLEGVAANYPIKFNKDLAATVYNGNKIDNDGIQQTAYPKIFGNQPVVLNGVVINDPEVLKHVYVTRMTPKNTAMRGIAPVMKMDPQKKETVPTGEYQWSDSEELKGYFTFDFAIDPEGMNLLEDQFPGEHEPLDASYSNVVPDWKDPNYTLGGMEANDGFMWGNDVSNEARKAGIGIVSSDGFTGHDYFTIEGYVPANATIHLDNSAGNATTHNMEVYNNQIHPKDNSTDSQIQGFYNYRASVEND